MKHILQIILFSMLWMPQVIQASQLLPEELHLEINQHECILAAQEDVAIANLDIKISRATVRSQKANFLPKLTITGAYKHKINGEGARADKYESIAKVNFSWPLFNGMRDRSAIDSGTHAMGALKYQNINVEAEGLRVSKEESNDSNKKQISAVAHKRKELQISSQSSQDELNNSDVLLVSSNDQVEEEAWIKEKEQLIREERAEKKQANKEQEGCHIFDVLESGVMGVVSITDAATDGIGKLGKKLSGAKLFNQTNTPADKNSDVDGEAQTNEVMSEPEQASRQEQDGDESWIKEKEQIIEADLVSKEAKERQTWWELEEAQMREEELAVSDTLTSEEEKSKEDLLLNKQQQNDEKAEDGGEFNLVASEEFSNKVNAKKSTKESEALSIKLSILGMKWEF